MPDTPVDFDSIGALGRALLAQLAPITGTRGTGTVTVASTAVGEVVLPANTYLLPVVEGELSDHLPFKVAPDPAGVDSYGYGGPWTVPDGGSLQVAVKSNVGGARHNLSAGTVFRFDPPVAGLEPTCTLDAAVTDAADGPLIQSANYYEDVDSNQLQRDVHAGRLSHFPGVLLLWLSSAPAEGRSSGTSQGTTRLEDGKRLFRETFRLLVVAGNFSRDKARRASGLVVLQAVTRMLTDQQRNLDGEQLTSLGSLEIIGRNRFARDEKLYAYSLDLRVNRVVARCDDRSFEPWLLSTLEMALPGREAPEPTAKLPIVDIGIPIPPGPP